MVCLICYIRSVASLPTLNHVLIVEIVVPDAQNTQEWMKNGEVLISLINHIQPDSVKKWNKGKKKIKNLEDDQAGLN